jgi:hypothetical protein
MDRWAEKKEERKKRKERETRVKKKGYRVQDIDERMVVWVCFGGG